MSRRTLIIAVGYIIIAGILIFCRPACFITNDHRGVAADVAGLSAVYKTAGHSYAAFYTNSFLQRLPFNQPISWRRSDGRPSVSLTGRVDVAAFRVKMASESFEYLSTNNSSGKESVATFIIHHRAGDGVVMTFGSLDLATGSFW